MSKKMMPLLLLFCLLIVNLGYTGSMKDEEDAIKALLKECQETWNNGDIQGWLALWHENAKIMWGRDRKIATKVEYEKILPDRMAANPEYKFGKPKVNVSGKEATVKTSMIVRGRSSAITLKAIKENSQWLLISWKY